MKHITMILVAVLTLAVSAFGQSNFIKELPKDAWPASMTGYAGMSYANSATHTFAPIYAAELDSIHFGIAFPDTFSISKVYFYTYPTASSTVGEKLTDTLAAASGTAATYLYYPLGVRFGTEMGGYVKAIVYFAGSGNTVLTTKKYRMYFKGFRHSDPR